MANLRISDVLDVLGISYKSGKISGNIDCPLCDRDGKVHRLHISFEKDMWRCAKCNNSGGIIHLYAFLKYGMTKDEVNANPTQRKKIYHELCEMVGNENLQTRTPVVYEKIDADVAPIEIRNEAYNLLLKSLGLSKEHYNDLIRRGLRKQDIINNGYRSFPIKDFDKIASNIRLKGIELKGIPGFYKENGNWSLRKYYDSYMIPVRNLFKEIQGIQVRFMNPTKSSNKYNWLSTNEMQDGAGVKTWCHFCGYPEKNIILTEGPLKADVIYRFLNVPVLAVPGVNALNEMHDTLKYLKTVGVHKIYTAFDMDFLQNPHVQSGYNRLLEILTKEYGFEVEMLLWDEKFKGLDDYLLSQYLKYGGKLDSMI